MVDNKLCQLLNIKYPIIQGGMAWVATAELAAAVSNAGGLGVIGAGHMPPEALRSEIHKTKALTDKPYGVNIIAYVSICARGHAGCCRGKSSCNNYGCGKSGRIYSCAAGSRNEDYSSCCFSCIGKTFGTDRRGCIDCGRNGKRGSYR